MFNEQRAPGRVNPLPSPPSPHPPQPQDSTYILTVCRALPCTWVRHLLIVPPQTRGSLCQEGQRRRLNPLPPESKVALPTPLRSARYLCYFKCESRRGSFIALQETGASLFSGVCVCLCVYARTCSSVFVCAIVCGSLCVYVAGRCLKMMSVYLCVSVNDFIDYFSY